MTQDSADTSLTFLTWNLALLARSAEAPPAWTDEHGQLAVREVVLAVEPDVVLFQELPGLCPYVETHDMIRANPLTHSGNLGVLVSNELIERWGRPAHVVVDRCAVLITFEDPGPALTIADVHLAPGKGGTAERLAQLAAVIDASPTPDLAIIGDLNTRAAELATLNDAGIATPAPPRPTWDSRRNRFHRRGREFTATFTRACSFGSVTMSGQRVLVEPVDEAGHRFHLSDHYPLIGRLTTGSTAAKS